MKTLTQLVAWSFAATVVVWTLVNPEGGVVYQNPVAAGAVGLIGLGLCLEARKRALRHG